MLVPSLAYAGALYAGGRNAGILDIVSPWWVLTMAVILLLSPFYHGWIIQVVARRANRKGEGTGGGAPAIEAFSRLFLGELLVAAGVSLGTVALVLPGIYFGIRVVWYKQAIVLGQMAPTAAVRESFRRTRGGRAAALAGVTLGGYYGVALGSDVALALVGSGALEAILSIGVSGFLLATLNTLLTDAYVSGWTRPAMEPSAGTS